MIDADESYYTRRRIRQLLVAVLLLFLVCSQKQIGSCEEETRPPESGIPKGFRDLGDNLMYSTFLLSGIAQDNPLTGEREEIVGTAFLVAIPVSDSPKQFRLALVTAKHVLDDIIADFATVELRRRDAMGVWQTWPVKLKIKDGPTKPLYVRHPLCDAAALPLLDAISAEERKDIQLAFDSGDVSPIPLAVLATDEDLQRAAIHPGFPFYCLGYPKGFRGTHGFPIERIGCLASWPIIPTRQASEILVDLSVIEGNSGGPVYFRTDFKGELVIRQGVIGLLSSKRSKGGVDLHVGGVVPACFIRDLLQPAPALPLNSRK